MTVSKAKGRSRVRYYNGQLLAAGDLRDDVDYEARMRELHVRALHGVWGIALGYEVNPASNKKFISVTQGMAYDCSGREIVMSATLALDAPQAPRGSNAQAWWFDLLIRYDDRSASAREYVESRACPEADTNLQDDWLTWRWSYAGDAPTPFVGPLGFADDVRLGEEIPLARIRVTNQGEFAELDLTVRRVAHGLVRPHIFGGQVRQGSVPIHGSPWHWTAWIDTSSGGFNTRNPTYFVSLVDHPWLNPVSGFADITFRWLPPERQQQLLGPFITIKDPTRTGFTLDVRMASVNIGTFDSMPRATFQTVGLNLPVAVNWLGMEPAGGCQPPRESSRIYWASHLLRLIQFLDLRLFTPG